MGNNTLRYQLYGHRVTVYTDHAAAKAVLGAPGKHARWWNKVHGSGIKEVNIAYQAKQNNCHADALSRQLVLPPPVEDESAKEVQVALISSRDDVGITDLVSHLLDVSPSFSDEQWSDGLLQPMILYLRDGELLEDGSVGRKILTESVLFILYYVGPKSENIPRAVVSSSLQQHVMAEYHSGNLAGHYSGPCLYKSLRGKWWWKYMYRVTMNYAKNCPQCAIVQGAGRNRNLCCIPFPLNAHSK